MVTHRYARYWPEVISHKLNVDPNHKPVRCEEVRRLVKAGFVKEVQYPNLLANVVIVKKKKGKWWVFIDFVDLNKACPKDSFPFPRINLLVDATTSLQLLSLKNAFSNYNQIHMHLDDQEKTACNTKREAYCYRVMHFRLKNVGDALWETPYEAT